MVNKNTINPTDYQVGQEAFYHDSGEIYRVKVLEVTGDREIEGYSLEVLERIQESRIVLPSDVGEQFSCSKKRDVSCSGLWHLLDN